MRIVNRTQFLALPAGTVYQKYTPMVTDHDLAMKHSNCGSNDWFELMLGGVASIDHHSSGELNDLTEDMEKNGTSVPYGPGIMRDGCFDEGQLFLVYEPADVLKLANQLLNGLTGILPP